MRNSRSQRIVVLLCLFVIACSPASAVEKYFKGREVFLVLPSDVGQREGSAWTFFRVVIAAAVADDGSLVVPADPDWKSRGLPTVLDAKVHAAKMNSKENTFELKLSYVPHGSDKKYRYVSNSALQIFVANASRGYEVALSEIILPRQPANDARNQQAIEAAMKPFIEEYIKSVFVGPLASVPKEEQWALAITVQQLAPGSRLGYEDFKDQRYFSVDLGAWSTVFNTQQVNQAQRVARSIAERTFEPLKLLSSVASEDHWAGILVSMRVAFRDFTGYAEAEYDEVKLFVPLQLTKEFAAFEITDQEMIDGSVVVLNGSRAHVDLTAQ